MAGVGQVLAFWQNPEFVRYRRADLRAGRMGAVVAIVGVVCWTIGQAVWNAGSESRLAADRFRSYFLILLFIQGFLMALWSFASCSQSVVSERDKKTYDFQRATALSTSEILVGKLLGAPIIGYWVFLCVTPVAVASAIAAHVSLAAILGAYLLIILFVLLLGGCGLVISMNAEKQHHGVVLLGFFVLYLMSIPAIAFQLAEREQGQGLLPGVAALNPTIAITNLLTEPEKTLRAEAAPFFGHMTPLYLLSMMLYVTLGAWIVLMLRRNLKADFDEIRLLNRWQLLGLAVFFNWLFYGFLNPISTESFYPFTRTTAPDITQVALPLNLFLVAMVGLFSVTPTLHLRKWYWQKQEGREGYVAENGPPWPWLLMAAALGYMLYSVAAVAMSSIFPLEQWKLRDTAGWTLLGTLFILEHVMFIQLLAVSKIKRAVFKGILLLVLYYSAVTIFALGLQKSNPQASTAMLSILTPFAGAGEGFQLWGMASIAGMVLQAAVTALWIKLINDRLSKKAVSPPIGVAAKTA